MKGQQEPLTARSATFAFPLPPADNPLWDVILDGLAMPQRYDVAVEPGAADRQPCPACQTPGEKVTYHGMVPVAADDADEASGTVRVTVDGAQVRFAGLQSVTFEPCGHRFDGRTGEQITG